jgi:hypothetical protein
LALSERFNSLLAAELDKYATRLLARHLSLHDVRVADRTLLRCLVLLVVPLAFAIMEFFNPELGGASETVERTPPSLNG